MAEDTRADVLTADWPPINFAVPQGFHDIPMAPDPVQRTEQLNNWLDAVLSASDEEAQVALLAMWLNMTEMLLREGVIYGAIAHYTNDEDERTAANLTVTVTESDHDIPDTAVLALTEMFGKISPHAEVRSVALPCGPATVKSEVSMISIPPELSGSGEAVEFPVGEIQAYVPFPKAPWVAVFQLSTPCLKDWSMYSEAMAAILQTIEFPNPQQEDQPGPLSAGDPSGEAQGSQQEPGEPSV